MNERDISKVCFKRAVIRATIYILALWLLSIFNKLNVGIAEMFTLMEYFCVVAFMEFLVELRDQIQYRKLGEIWTQRSSRPSSN